MTLNGAQRQHLVSAYVTVCHLLLQMEEAGFEGRSPTGVGSPLTPLPEDVVESVCGPLRALRQRLREQVVSMAPQELEEFERPQSVGNTVIWLSNLHDRIRGAVDSLQPGKMRKYGREMGDDEQLLAALHGELTQMLKQARTALDHEE